MHFKVAIFIACTASAAVAETPIPPLDRCTAIVADTERLACFDALAGSVGGQGPAPTADAAKPAGKWVVERTKNPVDDTETVIATLVADSGGGSYGRQTALLLRCQSNQTEVFLSWGDYLATDGDYDTAYKNVLTRIGSDPATTTRWSTSTDQTATFAPDAIALLRAMVTSDRFVAKVTPYNASPITAVFDTAGINAAVAPISEVCGWSLAAQ